MIKLLLMPIFLITNILKNILSILLNTGINIGIKIFLIFLVLFFIIKTKPFGVDITDFFHNIDATDIFYKTKDILLDFFYSLKKKI